MAENKKILYQHFEERTRAVKEQQELGEQFGVAADKIVVKKESAGAKFLSILSTMGVTLLKIIIGIIGTALVSFALTVLMNTQLRTAVFEIMKTW